jgi:hypothetical protein
MSVQTNYSAQGQTGMTVNVYLTDDHGNPCTETFTGGILTSTTCDDSTFTPSISTSLGSGADINGYKAKK